MPYKVLAKADNRNSLREALLSWTCLIKLLSALQSDSASMKRKNKYEKWLYMQFQNYVS